jgi:hypothetical protein
MSNLSKTADHTKSLNSGKLAIHEDKFIFFTKHEINNMYEPRTFDCGSLSIPPDTE